MEGATRGMIMDTQRCRYRFIPKSLAAILLSSKTYNIKKLIKEYGKQNEQHIKDYFNFLVANEFVFSTDTPNHFPSIEKQYKVPSAITNAIIELSKGSSINTTITALEKLDEVNCKAIQFIISEYTEIERIISYSNRLKLTSIEIIDKYEPSKIKKYDKLLKQYGKLLSVTLHSASCDRINYSVEDKYKPLFLIKNVINQKNDCGKINPFFFSINLETYLESINFNTCLYKKIFIDDLGNIKNCPSCAQFFGNISDTTLEQVLNHPDFKKYWNITKDKIDVCKDCEFRHMCTDCRAYIKDPENIYSQPAKCTYNPYIAKWEGEDGYVSIEKCGKYSRRKGFVVDENKVNALNNELWGG